MNALSFWRPWPWAIVHAPNNPKRVENRTWKPWDSVIGQRIALHAATRFDRDAVDFIDDVVTGVAPELDNADLCPKRSADHPTGIIGTARVLGWVDTETRSWSPGLDFAQALDALGSDWTCGPVGWVLGDILALPEPIPCSGAQGLWTVPQDIARQIEAGRPAQPAMPKPAPCAPAPEEAEPTVLPGQLVLL